MCEFAEAVTLPDGGHIADRCCFCPIETVQNPTIVAKIGKHNNSDTLGTRLQQSGDPGTAHLYEDSLYGEYSVEAHHLICGNEILGDERETEKYLITQDKTTTKGAAGLVESSLHDVKWDVNDARNGIWLPSVPDMYRQVEGDPAVWWGKQTKASGRTFLKESERNDISFIVMKEAKRQFHKGAHGSAAPPEQSYVDLGIKELKKVRKVLAYYSRECPMEDGHEKRRTSPPYRPPHGIAHALDLLSDRLKRELEGEPSSWRYFISKYAKRCAEWEKAHP